MLFFKEVLRVFSSIRRENNVLYMATKLVNVVIGENGKRLRKMLPLA